MTRTYVGWCKECRSLSEFADSRTCHRTRGMLSPGYGTAMHRRTCHGRIELLWENVPLEAAILTAYRIGGWDAAVAVWVDAKQPELNHYDVR